MPAIESLVDTGSQSFQENREAMEQHVRGFRALEQAIEDKAFTKKAKYEKRGQLLPRERLELLIDPDRPFLELSSLAGYKMYGDKDGTSAGGSAITGIGYVSGIRCIVMVDNYAIKGGTITPIGLQKRLRLQQIALENKLPIVALSQSGGADLNHATETFSPGGRAFYNQARMSAAGIPQITVVHGSATAGGAYQPGLSDYTIMVRKQATMYLAGPPLLKAATGEIATDEELGGAEMHCQTAGTGEYLAENDGDAIRIVREIMSMLPWEKKLPPKAAVEFEEPLYGIDELMGLVPADAKTPYDVREVIARLADGSRFLEFKGEYDQQTICGHLTIEGMTCGVIGNNGPITPEGATKAAQFIHTLDQSGIPLLFLHNTTGFMVGTEVERKGIIKHGSKMIQAVANARIPRISIVIGGSYGAGNYAMCGRGFDPRFLFAWPNSTTAVMGAAQAGKVLRIVAEAKMERMGQQMPAEMIDALEQKTVKQMEDGSSALACTARLLDDGLIDPRDTRKILALVLDICRTAEVRELNSSTFGVSRF
ncbi:acyl-CoA carboxylase subunit beta [Parendozoicomonas haliclonae]|uniref:Methylmalonyl-CoA carboxyltransferase 12S subunit n=1 Tax=Parendozoicomonas haliclonae TaxID=1960125 RepID=A0A1X7AFD9_9GAMM|nr:acyl-CoA carboxylase subunit beta [Parendozoicomonas haliclonae]SMA34888.1 Methylmalonyl-CoA carboxyltransferase 12S subunit [Parendozoicomonas haliclonae]